MLSKPFPLLVGSFAGHSESKDLVVQEGKDDLK